MPCMQIHASSMIYLTSAWSRPISQGRILRTILNHSPVTMAYKDLRVTTSHEHLIQEYLSWLSKAPDAFDLGALAPAQEGGTLHTLAVCCQ